MDAPGAPAPVHYAGFWRRTLAFLVDSVLAGLLLAPFGMLLHVNVDHTVHLHPDFGLAPLRAMDLKSFTVNVLLPTVAVLAFWFTRGATPGKMVVRAAIVDAATLGPASQRQMVARYLGYYVSSLVVGLGFLWVAFDARKQGWHDKIAGTVVIVRPR